VLQTLGVRALLVALLAGVLFTTAPPLLQVSMRRCREGLYNPLPLPLTKQLAVDSADAVFTRLYSAQRPLPTCHRAEKPTGRVATVSRDSLSEFLRVAMKHS